MLRICVAIGAMVVVLAQPADLKTTVTSYVGDATVADDVAQAPHS